jgi:hypothetical protein
MPITATCPGCKQTLSVQDQYAGMQGKCPTCGTVLTFPVPPPSVFPMAPSAPPPPLPDFSPAPSGGSAYAGGPPASRAPGTTFSLAGLDQMASILLPVGLFFLLLEALATFLPWVSNPLRSYSGIALGAATLFLFLCLIVGGIVATTFFVKENLALSAVIGAAFGTFSLLCLLAEMSLASRQGGTGAGLWIGFLSAIGVTAAFAALAVLQPLEWPYLKTLNLPPIFQRYGALVASQAGAFALGFLFLLMTLGA